MKIKGVESITQVIALFFFLIIGVDIIIGKEN